MLSKNILIFAFLGAALATLCGTAEAQPTKIPRIGYLIVPSLAMNASRVEAFRQRLRELGYIENKSIVIEWRSAEGKVERLPELTTELLRHKVDIIVSAGPTATRIAEQATAQIPIVMAQDTDPVGNGFIASLARPGGNVTGLSLLAPEIAGKQIELLKDIVPRLSRVAAIGEPGNPGYAQQHKELEQVAAAFKVRLQNLDVRGPRDAAAVFEAAAHDRADAALVLGGPVLVSQRDKVVALAAKFRLPAIYNEHLFVEAGGLMTYAANFSDLHHRAAIYVDKILKGAKPADLPVEQPTKFELVINLKAAKQIGLTIPSNVLARADKVIRYSSSNRKSAIQNERDSP